MVMIVVDAFIQIDVCLWLTDDLDCNTSCCWTSRYLLAAVSVFLTVSQILKFCRLMESLKKNDQKLLARDWIILLLQS